jgi:hypothetical protein
MDETKKLNVLRSCTRDLMERMKSITNIASIIENEFVRGFESAVIFCDSFCMKSNRVQVYRGIELLALALGQKLQKRPFGLDEYQSEKHFTFDGFEFFQLSDKEVSQDAGPSKADSSNQESDGGAGHTAQSTQTAI